MSVAAASEVVRPDYRHGLKLVQPASTVALGDAVLKWYDIAPREEPVAEHVRSLALRGLADAVRLGELRLGEALGFVILHRCGAGFHFLLVSTWRNDNELWETVWAKDGDASGFHPWTLEGAHRPTFCVWELGAVWHEQQAWSRFLRSDRSPAAEAAYLQDAFEGEV